MAVFEKRGPGRPKKVVETKESVKTVKKLPRRRRAVGEDFNLKLSIPPEARERLGKEFHLRWVNNKDGRDHTFNTMDDYEYVTWTELGGYVGDDSMNSKSVGGNVSRPVGDGVTAFLMKKRKEFYDEDQATKEAKRSGIEDQIRANQYKNKGEDTYGETKITREE